MILYSNYINYALCMHLFMCLAITGRAKDAHRTRKSEREREYSTRNLNVSMICAHSTANKT